MAKLEKIVTENTEEEPFYIASVELGEGNGNQGVDEMYVAALAYCDKTNLALVGEPGVGKNQFLRKFNHMIHPNKKLIRVVCGPRTQIEDILGGVGIGTKEFYDEQGKFVQATPTTDEVQLAAVGEALFENGEIAIIDEIFRMNDQGTLNGVADEHAWTCGNKTYKFREGAFMVVTGNPGEGSGTTDMEKAFGNRLSYIEFEALPVDLQINIALVQSGLAKKEELFDEQLEDRAIVFKENPATKKKVPIRYIKEGEKYKCVTGKFEDLDENDSSLHKYKFYNRDKKTTKDYKPNLPKPRLKEIEEAKAFLRPYVNLNYDLARFLKTGSLEENSNSVGEPSFSDIVYQPTPRFIIDVAKTYANMKFEGSDMQSIMNVASDLYMNKFIQGDTEDKVMDTEQGTVKLKEYLKSVLSQREVNVGDKQYLMYESGEISEDFNEGEL